MIKSDKIYISAYWIIGFAIVALCLIPSIMEFGTWNLGFLYAIPLTYIMIGIGLTDRIKKEK